MTAAARASSFTLDDWLDAVAPGAVRAGAAAAPVQSQHDGWWFGALDVDPGDDLEAATHRAYAALTAQLAAAGAPRLVRVWNLLPRLHDEEQGLERYRRFNAGRQRALTEAGSAAFAGAPAACALGRDGGPLSIRWLATQRPARAIENPRQVPAWRYDRRYGPRAPSFSRAMRVGDEWLFVSGTASIVGQDSVHPGDVAAQTAETLANLRAVLAEAGPGFTLPRLRCTVYLRDAADRPRVEPLLAAAGVRPVAWLRADVCRRELLVEIEGHARVEAA